MYSKRTRNRKKLTFLFLTALGLFSSLIVLALNIANPQYLASLASGESITFFVSPRGSDANTGTEQSPFKTITKCAQVARAGTTCLIRAGEYSETVVPTNSGTQNAPIVFRGYPGEQVTVTAVQNIDNSGWKFDSQNKTYSKPLPFVLNTEVSEPQLFVNSKMYIEAQWPNKTLELDAPVFGVAKAGTNISSLKADIPTHNGHGQPISWKNKTVQILGGYEWTNYTTSVVDAAVGELLLKTWPVDEQNIAPKEGNRFYVQGGLELLDSWGEWYLDRNTNTVYFRPWEDIGISQLKIGLKNRNILFNLENKKYVQVRDIELFGGTISTDWRSSSITLDKITGYYLSHNTSSVYAGKNDPYGAHKYSSGLLLHGDNNSLSNSKLNYSSGNGVTVFGNNNTVESTQIFQTGYSGLWTAGIYVDGRNNKITNNSIAFTGRDGIALAGTPDEKNEKRSQNQVSGNVVRSYGFVNRDVGGIYIGYSHPEKDGGGNLISNNVIRDAVQKPDYGTGSHSSAGIYLDQGTGSVTILNNIVFESKGEAVRMNGPSSPQEYISNANVHILNNTFGKGQQFTLNTYLARSFPNLTFVNNVYSDPLAVENTEIAESELTSMGALDVAGNQRYSNLNEVLLEYYPVPGSKVIDAGSLPQNQYLRGLLQRSRSLVGPVDVGAYEYQP